jgi:hypothetical protein
MSSFERFQRRAKLSNEAIAILITFLGGPQNFPALLGSKAGSCGRQQVVVGGEVVMGGNR